jgi:hypothetical protein
MSDAVAKMKETVSLNKPRKGQIQQTCCQCHIKRLPAHFHRDIALPLWNSNNNNIRFKIRLVRSGPVVRKACWKISTWKTQKYKKG